MKKIILASLAIALAGCGPSEEEIKKQENAVKNKEALEKVIKRIGIANNNCGRFEIASIYVERGCRSTDMQREGWRSYTLIASEDYVLLNMISKVIIEPFAVPPDIASQMKNPQDTTTSAQIDGANITWYINIDCGDLQCEKKVFFSVTPVIL